MANPKKEIARYKTGTCLTCNKINAKLSAGRCIQSPYCYEKHRKEVRDTRNAERGTEPARKAVYVIPKQSAKRKKLDAIYNIAAAQYKKDHKHCKAALPGCQFYTKHVHHLHSGKDKLKFYLDQSTWLPVCDNCHHIIHDVLTKDEAVLLGLKRIEP